MNRLFWWIGLIVGSVYAKIGEWLESLRGGWRVGTFRPEPETPQLTLPLLEQIGQDLKNAMISAGWLKVEE